MYCHEEMQGREREKKKERERGEGEGEEGERNDCQRRYDRVKRSTN